jgi:pimeloyl-ACP methyl ester carboxylesterase
MIETFVAELPQGIQLHCRAAGPKGAPVLMFLHGFPEGAFVWDELLEHFSDRYRCIAPNLRGYAPSSRPEGVEAYSVAALVGDVLGLIAQQGAPIEALIAHDWGGGVAWALAINRPQAIKRLIIVNSPHPATFLKALQTDAEQQAASAYMNAMQDLHIAAHLSADDYAYFWERLRVTSPTADQWLTDEVKEQYRSVWRGGLEGMLNYYRASPLRPPTEHDRSIMSLQFPAEAVQVKVPTHVIWAEDDHALRLHLLDGLDAYVPQLTIARIPGASHWVVHEKPAVVAQEIESALSR